MRHHCVNRSVIDELRAKIAAIRLAVERDADRRFRKLRPNGWHPDTTKATHADRSAWAQCLAESLGCRQAQINFLTGKITRLERSRRKVA